MRRLRLAGAYANEKPRHRVHGNIHHSASARPRGKVKSLHRLDSIFHFSNKRARTPRAPSSQIFIYYTISTSLSVFFRSYVCVCVF